MSMGHAPCCGYVVELTPEVAELLGITGDESGTIEVEIDGETVEVDIFTYNDDNGDIYDDLENETTYVSFDEDDLYTKKLTSVGKFMQKNKILPKILQWTNFG